MNILSKKRRNKVRMTVIFIFVMMSFLWDSTGGIFTIFGITPVMLIPTVIAVAMFERETTGGWFGLIAGLLWDLSGVRHSGFYAVMLLITGCAAGLIVSCFMHNNIYTALVLSGVFTSVFGLSDYLFELNKLGADGASLALRTIILPKCALTVVLIFPVYLIIKLISNKLKEP